MPLPKNAGECNELNLVENTENQTITAILTTHIPKKELQREYYTVLKAGKKEDNKKYEMTQLEGNVIGDKT